MEINHLPNIEFKVMMAKMLKELGRRMDEHCENFKKRLENIRKSHTLELKNTITEIKNILWDFPGSPMVKTSCLQCKRQRFSSRSEN